LVQFSATMMRCRAGGGPPRGGAYQTALIILALDLAKNYRALVFILALQHTKIH